jgi:hypothetical protein
MGDWLAPALLFGMIGFLGTMTCVESAEAAGDKYPMAEVMIVDGIGTSIAALFGGRGLHSSTSQLNFNCVCHKKTPKHLLKPP